MPAPEVFISYSSKDVILVRALVEQLRVEGIPVWFDQNLLAGDEWATLLEERIASCAALVVVVTQNSNCSDWVYKEMCLAHKHDKRIIPLDMEDNSMPIHRVHQIVKSVAILIRDLKQVLPGLPASVEPRWQGIFNVPYSDDHRFFNRSSEIALLEHLIHSAQPFTPVGVAGLPGVGKSRFVAEYSFRNRERFQDVIWINAKESLARGIANYASSLRADSAAVTGSELTQRGFEDMKSRPHSLIVIDELSDCMLLDAAVATPIFPQGTLRNLPGKVVFITNTPPTERDFVTVNALTTEDALAFFIQSCARGRSLADLDRRERREAGMICRMLGNLPLALRVAAAFLRRWPEIPFVDFRHRLTKEGRLPTLDAETARLHKRFLPTDHSPYLRNTFRLLWERVRDEATSLLVNFCSQLPDVSRISTSTLALFTGHSTKIEAGTPSPLRRAIRDLADVHLIDEISDREFSIHPLFAEFASLELSPSEREAIRQQCSANVQSAYASYQGIESHLMQRGVDAVQRDVLLAIGLHPPPTATNELCELLRLLRRQAANLRDWDAYSDPTRMPRQLGLEASLLALSRLRDEARGCLLQRDAHAIDLDWQSSRESASLVDVLTHTSAVFASFYSYNDELRVLTVSEFGMLTHWDARTGEALLSVATRQSAVSACNFSRAMEWLCIGHADGIVSIVAAEDGALVREFRAHDQAVTVIHTTAMGDYLITGSVGDSLSVWSLVAGELTTILVGHCGSVNAIVDLSLNNHIVSCGDDQQVIVWDAPTGKPLRRLRGHQFAATSAACWPTTNTLFTGDVSGTIFRWNVQSDTAGRIICRLPQAIEQLACSQDGRILTVVTSDWLLSLIDTESGSLLGTMPGHSDQVISVDMASGRELICSSSRDHSVRLWDMSRCRSPSASAVCPLDAVSDIAFTSDSQNVLAVSIDGGLYLWRDLNVATAIRLKQAVHGLTSIAVADERAFAIVADDLGVVEAVGCDSGETKWAVMLPCGVTSLVIVAASKVVACGRSDGVITLLDLRTGGVVKDVPSQLASLQCLAYSADCARLAVSAANGALALFDTGEWRLLASKNDLPSAVNSMHFGADGNLISAGEDGYLRYHSQINLSERSPMTFAHFGPIFDVAATANRRRFVTCGEDRRIVLWSYPHGRQLAELRFRHPVRTIALSPDGDRLATGDDLGSVSLLSVKWSQEQ